MGSIESLQEVAALGADVTIPLGQSDQDLDKQLTDLFAKGVDVVVDYLWGKSAERLLVAAAKTPTLCLFVTCKLAP